MAPSRKYLGVLRLVVVKTGYQPLPHSLSLSTELNTETDQNSKFRFALQALTHNSLALRSQWGRSWVEGPLSLSISQTDFRKPAEREGGGKEGLIFTYMPIELTTCP